jgi:hypothetical protein
VLFHELADGGIRVNFRADEGHNVSRLAAIWGGDRGHHASASLTLKDGAYATLCDIILRKSLFAFAPRWAVIHGNSRGHGNSVWRLPRNFGLKGKNNGGQIIFNRSGASRTTRTPAGF